MPVTKQQLDHIWNQAAGIAGYLQAKVWPKERLEQAQARVLAERGQRNHERAKANGTSK